MPDIISREKRSLLMSRIRCDCTAPEVMMSAILESLGIEFEAHPRGVFGRPDFVLAGRRVAIFCDGDFWHGRGRIPRIRFWRDKIARNVRRDKSVNAFLRKSGWSVLRFRESGIMKRPDSCTRRLLRKVRPRDRVPRHVVH